MDQLRAIRTFLEVVDRGGFAGAARSLELSPSVVTRLVSELEHHLGTRLLNRTTRSVVLTKAGQAYADETRQLLHALCDADAAARESTALPRGRLKIQVPPSFAVHQLAKVLPEFRSKYPKITLEIQAMGAVDSVNDGCDLSIIVAQGDKIDGDFVANPLARTEILLCASPLYINNSKKILHPQDLSAHEVLVPPIAAIRRSVKFITTDAISETSAAVFFQPKEPAVSSLHLDAMYATALAGMGIVGLPSFMADDALRSGALIRVLHKWHVATLSVWVGVPSRRHLPIATRAFRDFLVEKFGTNPREDPWLALGGENSSPSSLSKNYQSVKLAVIPS